LFSFSSSHISLRRSIKMERKGTRNDLTAIRDIHTPIICYRRPVGIMLKVAVVRWLWGKEGKPDFIFFFSFILISNFFVVVPKN
jgi:hypothetical protein